MLCKSEDLGSNPSIRRKPSVVTVALVLCRGSGGRGGRILGSSQPGRWRYRERLMQTKQKVTNGTHMCHVAHAPVFTHTDGHIT